MLYSICQESKDFPTSAQLDHAIKRNFDGFETDEFNPFEEFKSVIPKYRPINLKNIPMKVRKKIISDNWLNNHVILYNYIIATSYC